MSSTTAILSVISRMDASVAETASPPRSAASAVWVTISSVSRACPAFCWAPVPTRSTDADASDARRGLLPRAVRHLARRLAHAPARSGEVPGAELHGGGDVPQASDRVVERAGEDSHLVAAVVGNRDREIAPGHLLRHALERRDAAREGFRQQRLRSEDHEEERRAGAGRDDGDREHAAGGGLLQLVDLQLALVDERGDLLDEALVALALRADDQVAGRGGVPGLDGGDERVIHRGRELVPGAARVVHRAPVQVVSERVLDGDEVIVDDVLQLEDAVLEEPDPVRIRLAGEDPELRPDLVQVGPKLGEALERLLAVADLLVQGSAHLHAAEGNHVARERERHRGEDEAGDEEQPGADAEALARRDAAEPPLHDDSHSRSGDPLLPNGDEEALDDRLSFLREHVLDEPLRVASRQAFRHEEQRTREEIRAGADVPVARAHLVEVDGMDGVLHASPEWRKPTDATQMAPSDAVTSRSCSLICSTSRIPGWNATPSSTSSWRSCTVARLLAIGSMNATTGTSLPPSSFQLFTLPVKMSLSCARVTPFTGFALFTNTARPS